MTMNFDRRQLMLAGLAGTTMLLPGCQSTPRISLTEIIRSGIPACRSPTFAAPITVADTCFSK